jgi:hypothetical protein
LIDTRHRPRRRSCSSRRASQAGAPISPRVWRFVVVGSSSSPRPPRLGAAVGAARLGGRKVSPPKSFAAPPEPWGGRPEDGRRLADVYFKPFIQHPPRSEAPPRSLAVGGFGKTLKRKTKAKAG